MKLSSVEQNPVQVKQQSFYHFSKSTYLKISSKSLYMSQEPFVYFNVFGGLGNQMFQYAAAYVVSKTRNVKLYIKDSGENHHNTKGHNYVRKLFVDASECFTDPGPYVEYLHRDFFPWTPQEIQIPARLRGHFQYYPTLVPFLPELTRKFSEALQIGEKNNSVLLHVRRGDYLNHPNVHYLQGQEYYMTAYQHLVNRIQAIPEKIIVFSDDIEWCKEQQWLKGIPNVVFYENEDELETLAEMARCGGGAIIANSTFSWWGAVLSGTTHVYYPSRWIAAPVYDLFPEGWICI